MLDYVCEVTEEIVGQRIDQYLSQQLNDLSRSHIQKLIKAGHVTIKGKACKANYKLRLNDVIEVTIPEPEVLKIEPENIPLDIIYSDDDVAVINKPQGMVVHPAPGHFSGTLVNALMYHFKDSLSGINGVKRPGIVHRIDKDTSGLIMICKNDKAHQSIAAQLKDHSTTRKYVALVYSNIKEDEGTVAGEIGRHPVDRKKMAMVKQGKHAVTHFKVLERYGDYTLVECQLETGRTHQIRVHLTSIHHPLVGDPMYGPQGKSVKKYGAKGQLLHAKVLGFKHPSTGEYMEFEAPLPGYFQAIINKVK